MFVANFGQSMAISSVSTHMEQAMTASREDGALPRAIDSSRRFSVGASVLLSSSAIANNPNLVEQSQVRRFS